MTRLFTLRLLVWALLWPAVGQAQSPRQPLADSLRAVLAQPALADSARTLAGLALCQALASSNLPAAIAAGEQALAAARRSARPALEARAYRALGMATMQSGDRAAAARYFQRGLAPAQRAGQAELLAGCLTGMGHLALDDRRLAEALRYYEQAQAALLRETPPNAPALARSYGNLAGAYAALGRNADVMKATSKARELFRQLGDAGSEARCLFNLAIGNQNMGRPAESRAYLAQAMRLHRQQGDSLSLSEDYRYLADRLRETQLPAARAAAATALRLARHVQAAEQEANCQKDLAALAAAAADFPAAYAHRTAYAAIQDTLVNREKLAAQAQFQAQFAAQRQQERIRELTRQRSQHQARSRRLALMAGGLLLGLAVLGGLYWQLRRSRTQLRNLSKTKDLLMAVVGHDLRGPVAAFEHLGQVIRLTAAAAPEELLVLGTEVEKTARGLSELLHNLLYWARSQSGLLAARPESVPLAALVSKVLALHQGSATAKQIALHHDVPTALLVNADPALLATVLRNLVGNAVKFTQKGGSIRVSAGAEANGGHVTLTVEDSGLGLTQAQLTDLFAPGAGRSRHGTAGESGTGLGLLVSQAFVRSMGDANGLRVQSPGPGRGSRFAFQLPVLG